MNLLLLGGTVFVGRHLTRAALDRGHRVTHFNRGRSGAPASPEVRTVVGDRDGGLDALEPLLRRERFDAVLDTCGYVPRVVRAAVERLADAVPFYAFVSTISVYADFRRPGVTEESPLLVLDDPDVEEGPGLYGPLKTACEGVVRATYGERALVLRPGLIAGPFDPTDRFTHWPLRLARGGDVLAPAPPERPVQWIDARDLAAFTLRLVEQRTGGTFNVVTPSTGFAELIAGCALPGVPHRVQWVDPAFLAEQGVEPWIELPLWLSGEETAGLLEVDASRARAAGLEHRSVAETARDTLTWARTRPKGYVAQAGLDEARERELLEHWRRR